MEKISRILPPSRRTQAAENSSQAVRPGAPDFRPKAMDSQASRGLSASQIRDKVSFNTTLDNQINDDLNSVKDSTPDLADKIRPQTSLTSNNVVVKTNTPESTKQTATDDLKTNTTDEAKAGAESLNPKNVETMRSNNAEGIKVNSAEAVKSNSSENVKANKTNSGPSLTEKAVTPQASMDIVDKVSLSKEKSETVAPKEAPEKTYRNMEEAKRMRSIERLSKSFFVEPGSVQAKKLTRESDLSKSEEIAEKVDKTNQFLA